MIDKNFHSPEFPRVSLFSEYVYFFGFPIPRHTWFTYFSFDSNVPLMSVEDPDVIFSRCFTRSSNEIAFFDFTRISVKNIFYILLRLKILNFSYFTIIIVNTTKNCVLNFLLCVSSIRCTCSLHCCSIKVMRCYELKGKY